jgi:hypothetical protein
MARTFTPITTIETASSSSTITLGSLPTTYTDLMIHGRYKCSSNVEVTMRVNNDSGNNYNFQSMYTGPGAQAGINAPYVTLCLSNSAAYFTTFELFIPNYNATNNLKTLWSRANDLYNGTSVFQIGGYESSSAITSVTLIANSGATFSAGAVFELYGIKAA